MPNSESKHKMLQKYLIKAKIDLNQDEPITQESFEKFCSLVNNKLVENEERLGIIERALNISTNEIKNYKKSIEDSRTIAIQNSRLAAIGEMSANISHEINNPLAIIHGKSMMLKMIFEDNFQHVDDEQKNMIYKTIDSIDYTTTRISKIIQGLKRLSHSSIDMAYKEEKIIDVIEESFSIGLENLKKSQIDFKFKYDPELKDLTVNIPSVEFSQVIVNLFTNAKQALEDLPVDQKRSFDINCFKSEDTFYIHFINSGPKIDSAIESKIFDSFFTTKPIGKGSGIGLNISKKIIEEMKGKLYLDTNHESPKFVIEIPLKN